jgi:hypothetical protein
MAGAGSVGLKCEAKAYPRPILPEAVAEYPLEPRSQIGGSATSRGMATIDRNG